VFYVVILSVILMTKQEFGALVQTGADSAITKATVNYVYQLRLPYSNEYPRLAYGLYFLRRIQTN